MSLSITSALRQLIGRRADLARPAPGTSCPAHSPTRVPQRWVEVANVPVFDAQHRQVGFIVAPADGSSRRFTAAAWMQRCMTEPVCWFPTDARTGDARPFQSSNGQVSQPHVNQWQRIALTHHDGSLVGIVLVAPPHVRAA